MAGTQAQKITALSAAGGVDLRSTNALRDPQYLISMKDCVYSPSNLFNKRKGFKAVATGSGAYGFGKLNIYNTTTGAITAEMVSIGNAGLQKATEVTLTIAYTGTNTCSVSLYFDPTNTQYYLKILEGTTVKLNQALGLGYDEASTYTVATLATAISAISGGLFTGTATGTTTISAALLSLTEGVVLTSTKSVALTAFSWATIYAPVADLFLWFYEYRNNDALNVCVPVSYRRSLFFPTLGSYGLIKYDGHAAYRAGVPSVPSLAGVETNAASASAEVTSIVTRQANGTAQVETVLVTSADTGSYETWTAQFNSGASASYSGKYMIAYDSAGSVALWFKVNSSDTIPVHGQDRAIMIDFHTYGTSGANKATALAAALDADAAFSATSSSNVATVVSSAAGARTDVAYGTAPSDKMTLTTTNNGTSGYASKYFDIYESSSARVSVWLNSGSDTQPSTGASRYIAVSYTAGSSASTIATAIKNAVDADSAFAASVATATVTITHSTAGSHGVIGAGDSGFTIGTTTAGIDALAGKYFTIYDTNGSVAVWFSYAGATVPAHGLTRALAITTVTAGMTAAQVANELKLGLDADAQFVATVVSSTVTCTDAATGPRKDASDVDTGFTISVTTQGGAAGIGTGTYLYKATVIHKDYVGVEIEGNASITPVSVVLSSGTKDALLTIGGVQADSGFNTGCARVNGGTTGTSITVDSGHTVQAGDTVYLKSGSAYVERTVVSTTTTNVTLNSSVTVLDDAIMSSGLRIAIYRTKVGGFDYFLVATIPNNSLDATFTYQDGALDSALTAQYIAPPVDLSPAGSFRSLALSRGGVGVGVGFGTDPDIIAYSDIDSMEYWPADTNLASVPTDRGDRANAVIANNENVVIGKVDFDNIGGSIHSVTGTLDEFANFSLDKKSQSVGITSQAGCLEVSPGIFAYPTSGGIYAQLGSGIPTSMSDRIASAISGGTTANSKMALGRVTAVNDTQNERCLFFFPIEPLSGTKYATDDSMVWVFDYSRGFDGQPSNRWYEWTGINAAGGFVYMGDEIYFIEKRFSSYTETVQTNLYKFHNTGTQSDYEDHKTAITPTLTFGWQDTGDISGEKDFLALKVLTTETPESDFVVGVSVDYDFIAGSAVTTSSLTVEADMGHDAVIPLKDHRALSVSVSFTNTEHKNNWSIEGYDLQVTKFEQGGMI